MSLTVDGATAGRRGGHLEHVSTRSANKREQHGNGAGRGGAGKNGAGKNGARKNGASARSAEPRGRKKRTPATRPIPAPPVHPALRQSGASRPQTKSPRARRSVAVTIGLPIVLAVLAATLTTAAPTIAGLALALLATVGSGLSLSLAASREQSTRLGIAAWSVPVGVAVSAISVQPLLWTNTYSVSSMPLALAGGAVLAHLAVGRVVREKAEQLAPLRLARLVRSRPGQRFWSALRDADRVEQAASIAMVGAAVLAFVAARTIGPDDPDGLGLVRVLPMTYWIGVVLAALGSLALITGQRSNRHWMIPAVWIAVLHGAPHSMQAQPRFPTGWLHLGFGDFLVREGGGGVGFDARFAWPGLFALVGAPLELLPDAAFNLLLRWWPVAIMVYLAALTWRIGQLAYPNLPLIGVMSSSLFVALNWTGQDYLSPQSLGIVLQLMIVILVEQAVRPRRAFGHWMPLARLLTSAPTDHSGRLPSGAQLRKASRTRVAGADAPSPDRVTAFLALVLAAGMIMSHPLSPIFLGVALVCLALYGRPLAWPLLTAVGAIFLCWFVLTAEPWWSTQVRGMLEQITDPLGNLGSSSSGRVLVPTEDRLVVTATRTRFGLGVIGAIFVFAFTNFVRRSLRPKIPLVPLAAGAIGVTALQSYGGEMAIRAYLFAVPFVAVMFARWILGLPRPTRPLLFSGAMVLLVVPFLLARFGNETFELTSDGDRAAIEAAYDVYTDAQAIDPDISSGLVSAIFVAPFGEQFSGDLPIVAVIVESPQQFSSDAREIGAQMGLDQLVAVFTESDRRFRIQTESMAPDWNVRFVEGLIDDGWVARYDEDGRYVLELRLS